MVCLKLFSWLVTKPFLESVEPERYSERAKEWGFGKRVAVKAASMRMRKYSKYRYEEP